MNFQIRRIGDEPKGRRWRKRVAAVAGAILWAARPIARLISVQREMLEEEKKEAKTRSILKKIVLGLLTVLGALVVIALVLRLLIALHLVSAQSFLTMTAAPLPKDAHGQTNILLLGQGDDAHEGVDLTDTIMIASIDEDTDSAVLLSIPRDLYLYNVEGAKNGRINELFLDRKAMAKRAGKTEQEANAQGMKEMAEILGNLVGIQLHGVLKIDFIGFVQAVDAIGGVTVDVPYTIVDREYPADHGYGYQTFMITEGPHKLDGETALKYARSRHTTSDFGRSARQQQLISTMAHQMKEDGILKSPGTLLDLYKIAGEHVQTTLTFGELAGLASVGRNIERDQIVSMQLNMSNGLYGAGSEPGGFLYPPPREQFGGASVLLPVSIPEFPVTWKQIRTFADLIFHHRELLVPHQLAVEIRNVSAQTGSAQRLAGELSRYGFNVLTAKNAPKEMQDQELANSRMFVPKEEKERGAFLSQMLGITSSETAEPLIDDTATGSVLILLGKDYTYVPVQDLLSSPQNP